MQRTLVLTVIGPDRPGLVGSIADTVAKHGGNWLEARMAHLADQFAGIVRLHVAPENEADLRQALAGLQAQGLNVTVLDAEDAAEPADVRPLNLELVGHDRPGIVRDVAAALSARSINVEELTTECGSAPMTGEPLFRAVVELSVPTGVDTADLLNSLDQIADELVLDLNVEQPLR